MRKLLIVVMAIMLNGCASAQYNRTTNDPTPKLDPSGSAYVLVPANAMYGTKECVGSGRTVGNLIYSAFLKHLSRVEVAPEGEKPSEGIKKAKDSGFTYLVDSKIPIWEDYVTEWNGKLDQIDIKMDVLDAESGKLLDSVNFKGNGTWFTFGGYHPRDIIQKQIFEYVDALFPYNTESRNK